MEKEQDRQTILKLTQADAKKTKVIFILGGILGLIAVILIIKFIIWIKGGGALKSLIKL